MERCEPVSSESSDVAELNPTLLLGMARGFSCVFWGLLATFILFFANAVFKIFNVIQMPAYVFGSATVALGVVMLCGSGRISRTWVICSRLALLSVVLEIYFAPFLVWWQKMPHVLFLLINALCLVMAGMASLFYINILVAESGRHMKDRGIRAEALLFAAAVFFLMIVPFVIMIGIPVASAVRHQTSLYFELWNMMNSFPVLLYALMVFPCSLTLVATWKAKDRCYHAFFSGH